MCFYYTDESNLTESKKLAFWKFYESNLAEASFEMVPVRYRPNAASGGWSYGRNLVSLPRRA